MGGFGITELLVVLAIVLLLFGSRKLKTLGSDMGNAIKGFRKAMSNNEASQSDQPEQPQQHQKQAADEAGKPD